MATTPSYCGDASMSIFVIIMQNTAEKQPIPHVAVLEYRL